MCQMKYLYDYCHMSECMSDAIEAYDDFHKPPSPYYRRGGSRDDYYDDYEPYYRNYDEITDDAETMALKKYSSGHYPSIFPWLLPKKIKLIFKKVK